MDDWPRHETLLVLQETPTFSFIGLHRARSLNGFLYCNSIKNIDLSAGEISRTDSSFEKQIQLSERATCRFGHAEVGVDDAKEANSRPKEAGVIAPIPLTRVEHVWRQNRANDADDIVKITAEYDGLDL